VCEPPVATVVLTKAVCAVIIALNGVPLGRSVPGEVGGSSHAVRRAADAATRRARYLIHLDLTWPRRAGAESEARDGVQSDSVSPSCISGKYDTAAAPQFRHSSFVSYGSIILPGVRIGSRGVIGAGSVVTRDVPEGVFAAGNPCRVIRDADAR
jgi:hypothetical protein